MDIFIRTIVDNAPLLVNATLVTLIGSLVSIVLAMILAVPTAFARIAKNPLLRSVSTFYVETIRGTPLLLQLLAWFYGARLLLLYLFNFNADTAVYHLLTGLNSNNLFPSQGVSNIFFAVIGLSFNYGAYLSEVIRAGIEAVDQGQTEAAQVLGLSRLQTARYITLPQALRIMAPPLTNNFITLIQDSSFWQVLGVYELSLTAFTLSQAISNSVIRWGLYSMELAIYFVICYSLAFASQRIETRLSRGVAGAN
ncbi:MAG TPA: amino acid ABC transporter permease [Ktedonobacterales bacterium]|jgi:His/Glu/Gln/Arg/opine family amino acid ABC transporter permease subunit